MCAFKDSQQEVPNVTNFSLRELKKLVEHENSCVTCVPQCVRSIDLMPLHLRDLKSSIQELLRSKVTKYDVELQGIILAHKNVKVNARSVQLSDRSSFPLAYQADIYLFKPQIGSTLTGIVNKIATKAGRTTYISVLVHNMFNVAVYSDEQPERRQTVAIGSEVTVQVLLINCTGRLPYIKGKLISPASEWDEADEPKKRKKSKKKSLIDAGSLGANHVSQIHSILKNSPIIKSNLSSTEADSLESSSTESAKARKLDLASPSIKKKKKKKDREMKDEPLSVYEVDLSSISKKRKRGLEESSDSASPSKKKKKDKDKGKALDVNPNSGSSIDKMVIPGLQNGSEIPPSSNSTLFGSPAPMSPPRKKKKKKDKLLSPDSTADLGASMLHKSIVDVKHELLFGEDALPTTNKKMVKEDIFNSATNMVENSKKKKTKEKKNKSDDSKSMNDITSELMQQALGHQKKSAIKDPSSSPSQKSTKMKSTAQNLVDMDNLAETKKRKKKVKDSRSMNDITSELMQQALELVKSECS